MISRRDGEAGVTYALCPATKCRHHDGDGCTLEEVELTVFATVDAILAQAGEDDEILETTATRLPPSCSYFDLAIDEVPDDTISRCAAT